MMIEIIMKDEYENSILLLKENLMKLKKKSH